MSDWPELHGPVERAAPRLLGAVLRHDQVAVRLTEVEAYAGSDDPGSHAHRGQTARNGTMFARRGRLYCYLSYGIHVCANVVVGVEGVGSAVLLRAGEVVDGLDVARERRPGVADGRLASGPACLTRALAIGLEHDGRDLSASPLRLALGAEVDHGYVATGPRVGLTGAPDRPWRFWLAGEPSVSRYRRSKRASRGVAGFSPR